MSNNRGGLFSFNRLFGKRKKKSVNVEHKLSAQTLAHLETVSTKNRLTPLITVPNAPFEQTFRITVYLPLQQLYVTRIGAKTKLCELLDMVCNSKLLDSHKFEFRHPADDTQVFDLSTTLGEVGLSELKLANKNAMKKYSEQHRKHSRPSQENHLLVRPQPHTKSPSPYSSTHSLNSFDSTGKVTNQKLRVEYVPSRKKRIAPKPPGQNNNPVELNQTNLIYHSLYVSSPNLSESNDVKIKLYCRSFSHADRSFANIVDKKLEKNLQTPFRNRFINDQTIENEYFQRYPFQNIEDQSIRCHSRTSRKISEIKKDKHFSEPQTKERPMGKKKAPVPPATTLLNEGTSQTTQPELRSVNEEETKDEKGNETTKEFQNIKANDETTKILKNLQNVSIDWNIYEFEPIRNEISNEMKKHLEKEHSSCSVNNSYIEESPKRKYYRPTFKQVPAGDITFPKNRNKHDEVINIDTNDILKEVNEIFGGALKINEEKLNARYIESDNPSKEINKKDEQISTSLNLTNCKQNILTEKPIMNRTEFPIQPVLHEERTFDNQECSDISLVTPKTFNTVGNSSTGPDSIITSDVEGSCKRNAICENRKYEIAFEESKEGFIENQFSFLTEHLESQLKFLDSIDEKNNFNSSKNNLISFTINDDYEIYKTTQAINELEHIVSEAPNEKHKQKLSEFPKINEYEKRSEPFIVPEAISRSMSFHSTFEQFIDHNNSNINERNGITRSISHVSLNNALKLETIQNMEAPSNIKELSNKKSSSDLSIVNAPRLQSIEVMKSILNNSLTFNRDVSPFSSKKTIYKSDLNNKNKNASDEPTKTWKYQGPPAVSFTTWGERPKSLVHIKNDVDYIFHDCSHTSKLKDENHNIIGSSGEDFDKFKGNCNNKSCNSVEYKKTNSINKKEEKSTLNSMKHLHRYCHDIPRITQPKSSGEINDNSYNCPLKSFIMSSLINTVQSSKCQNKIDREKNLLQVENEKTGKEDSFEKRLLKDSGKLELSQSALRITGLKEKNLDDGICINEYENIKKGIQTHKLNKNFNQSSFKTVSRDDLMTSIRNFNRDTLKRNFYVS